MTHRCLMKILALGKRNDFLVSINPSLINAVPMLFQLFSNILQQLGLRLKSISFIEQKMFLNNL